MAITQRIRDLRDGCGGGVDGPGGGGGRHGGSGENGGSGVLDLHCQNLFKQLLLPVRGRAARLPRRTVRIGLKSKK